MTISYGVTVRGISEQLVGESFTKVLVNNRYFYIANDITLGEVLLTRKDIYKLSYIIYNSLFTSHPILTEVVEYFNNMINMLNRLNLPMSWSTPSGMIIKQKYIKFTTYDLTNSIMGKRCKITLRKPLELNGVKLINHSKQINGFTPNFIHSLDASNIAILADKICKSGDFDILTIHDCFGTIANKVDTLSHLVKESFISIYGDDKFINKFHDNVMNNVLNTYSITDDKENVIDVDGDLVKIPVKPFSSFFLSR
jgi:DNA-directed RNA polymerase